MNPYGKKNIAGSVWDIVEPVAESLGLEIWNVEYVREGADMYLRITIDSANGIDIDDCERMHRAIDPVLDEADPIEGAYILEVSSPGCERVLTLDEHFRVMAGWDVELKLYRPIDGVKVVNGVLVGKEDGKIIIKVGDGEVSFDAKAVAKVTTIYDFSEDFKADKADK